MNRCPSCKHRISFFYHLKKFLDDPSGYNRICEDCGSYFKSTLKGRLITIIVTIPLAFLIFSKNYGLSDFIDNLVILILIFIAAEILLISLEKQEVVEREIRIKDLNTGKTEDITMNDWEAILRNGSENNYKIIEKENL